MGIFSRNKNIAGRTVASCCRQLNWSIDEQYEIASVLKFNSPIKKSGIEIVVIDDNQSIVSFMNDSLVSFPARNIDANMLFAVLRINDEMKFSHWSLREQSDGLYVFRQYFTALTEGLSPPIFKMICTKMSEQSTKLDSFLIDEGFAN